jgi:hypothetical protein
LKNGQTKLTDVLRQVGVNGAAAGHQYDLVSGQCPGNLEAAKKMADTQNILTILDDFHGYRFRVQGSGFRGSGLSDFGMKGIII